MRVVVGSLLMSWLLTAAAWGEPVCDRKAQPWLDAGCNPPDIKNPDHACRSRVYLKSQGINPKDPSRNFEIALGDVRSQYESYESMGFDVCEAFKTIRCAESAESVYNGFSKVLVDLTGTENSQLPLYIHNTGVGPSDLNLQRNFSSLAARNKEILQQLDSALLTVRQQSENVKTRNDVMKAESLLNEKFQPLRQQMSELAEQERRLLHLTDLSVRELGIHGEYGLTRSLGFDCDFRSGFSMAKYNEQLKSLIGIINDLRKEVGAAASERSYLVRIAYFKARYFIYDQFAKNNGKALDLLADDLQKDLWLSRTMLDFANWWASIFVNGLAGNLHLNYYFFSEPLRILKSERETALQFKDPIKRSPNFQTAMGAVALKKIDDKIAIIDRNIIFIESRGWQGLFEMQKADAKDRAALLPDNAACQKATKVFLDGAASVNSLESYDTNSRLFKIAVDFCKR